MSVPWLGTSWVDRAADYRRRRLLAVAVTAAGAIPVCGLSGGLLYGAWAAAGPVARGVIVVYVVAGMALGALFGWRLAGQVVPAAPRFPVLLLPLVFPFSCGAVLAVVVAWSLPVVPVERAARAQSSPAEFVPASPTDDHRDVALGGHHAADDGEPVGLAFTTLDGLVAAAGVSATCHEGHWTRTWTSTERSGKGLVHDAEHPVDAAKGLWKEAKWLDRGLRHGVARARRPRNV